VSRIFACMVSLWVLVPALAWADEKPVLAVMEIDDQAKKLSEDDIRNATDYLRAALVSTGNYFVVDRGRQENHRKSIVNKLKRETHDPCYDDTCKVELGRELAADTMLTCRLSSMGKTCIFSCELIPLDRAVSEAGGLEKFDCSMDGFSDAIDGLVASLSGESRQPDKIEPIKAPPTGYQPLGNTRPDDRVPVARPTYSLRDQYLQSGLPAGDYDDFLVSSLDTDGWRMYKRKRISGWHMAWCWMLPGSCMYTVALNGGNFWHFLRGLAYSGAYLGGYAMAINSAVDIGDSSSDSSSFGSYMALAAVGIFGNIIDGAFSISSTNRKMKRELKQQYPRGNSGTANYPGLGFTF
jgi:hypothetical protein